MANKIGYKYIVHADPMHVVRGIKQVAKYEMIELKYVIQFRLEITQKLNYKIWTLTYNNNNNILNRLEWLIINYYSERAHW